MQINNSARALDRWYDEGNGYIPYADHPIHSNCSWDNFKYYREKLKGIIFSTKVLK